VEARGKALEPADAARVLVPSAVPWWVSGGWAIELFVGRRTRPHADLDIGVWRDDFPRMTAALPDWEFHQAKGGLLTPLAPGEPLAKSTQTAWGRRRGDLWSLEVLVEDRDGGTWTYRRDCRVRRPESEVVHDAGGFRAIRPEIQLLYKSKDVRAKDQADFDLAAPALDPAARAWLAAALRTASLGHPWIARLA
jgi:hypothetical protein